MPPADGRVRCGWATSTPDYVAYHDEEWGRPLHGDREMFERASLEAFQSGLSWLTILRKREGFRAAFDGFDIEKVAAYDDADVARLLSDASIVRNRAKIHATINNARVIAQMSDQMSDQISDQTGDEMSDQTGESFSDLLWSFAPAPGTTPVPRSLSDVPAITPESTVMARALKKRGFRFVGPTTAYALMQATGMVNDHVEDCWLRDTMTR